jgi:hypothetical protein
MKDNELNKAVQTEDDEPKECKPKHYWRLIGAVGLLLAATAVITNLHDIKRYIRLTTM